MYKIDGYEEETLSKALELASVLAARYRRRVHVMTKAEYWTAPYSVAVFDKDGSRTTIQHEEGTRS